MATLTDEQAHAIGTILFLDPETGLIVSKERQRENLRAFFNEIAREVLCALVTKALSDSLRDKGVDA